MTRLLHRRRPHLLSLVCAVVVWFGAVGSADIIVLIVHVVGRVGVLRLRVDVAVVTSTRRGQGLVGRRLPAYRRHVRASACAVGAGLVVVG